MDPKKCRLEEKLFLCANNRTCLPLGQVCNGNPECPDGSDEGSECHNLFDCIVHSCSHDCIHLPTGPKCVCPQGYERKDDRTCEDINECETYGMSCLICRYCYRSYRDQFTSIMS